MQSSFLNPDDLNYYLRQYLATRHEPTRKQALEKVGEKLLRPSQILECNLLAEDHPLKREALVVSDAFEAVTNGMENPDALAQLNLLVPTNLFYPWKPLILALKALYQEQGEELRHQLENIPSTSPLHKLKPLLRALGGEDISLNYKEKEMALQLVDRSAYTSGILEQVQEALITGMEELFLTLLPSALEALVKVDLEAAGQLSLWALAQLEKYDLDYMELFSLLKQFWGESEGSRLIALGLIPLDLEAAILYWMAFLKHLPAGDKVSTAALEIFHDLSFALRDLQESQGMGEGFAQDFDQALHSVKSKHTDLPRYFIAPTWEDFQRPGKLNDLPPGKARTPEKAPVQFELFAS